MLHLQYAFSCFFVFLLLIFVTGCSEALQCYAACVEMMMENNKFSIAAKIWKEMATIQEKENDLKSAINSFQKAADCYEADNSTALVLCGFSSCLPSSFVSFPNLSHIFYCFIVCIIVCVYL